MTKEELVAANLVIMNMPYKHGISILSYINSLISSGKFQFDEDIRVSIHQVNERNVRTFLLEQGYTEPVNHSIPSDMLMEKGLKAREFGGHEGYLMWEENCRKEEEEAKKKLHKIGWPQRHWLLVGVIGFVFGVLGTLIEKIIERRIWPEPTPSGLTIPHKVDTFYLRIDPSKEKIKK